MSCMQVSYVIFQLHVGDCFPLTYWCIYHVHDAVCEQCCRCVCAMQGSVQQLHLTCLPMCFAMTSCRSFCRYWKSFCSTRTGSSKSLVFWCSVPLPKVTSLIQTILVFRCNLFQLLAGFHARQTGSTGYCIFVDVNFLVASIKVKCGMEESTIGLLYYTTLNLDHCIVQLLKL